MTLVDAVLQTAGAKELSQLTGLTDEKRRALAAGLTKIGADKVPLDQWNALLAAFGIKPRTDASEARALLIKFLSMPRTGEKSGGGTGGASTGTVVGQQVAQKKAAGEHPMQVGPTAAKPIGASPSAAAAPSTKKADVGGKPKKEKSIFVKVWNAFTTVLVLCVVVLACALVGVRLVGMQVYTVLSGSMEPVYHVGSLIYVKDVDPFALEIGDDITFLLDEDTVATHRIVGIVPDEEDPDTIRFRTKGVANEQEDGGLVHYRNVIGKPVFTIPYLGYLASYIQEPPGTFVAIAAGAVLMLLVFLPDLFASEDEDVETKPKKKKSV